ncbi:hypothetical protein BCV71DRAFT_283364 [Rhizopus microsporus]|uniref:Uncharacterized protein n=1 Tax=Rhizopus microsporus TaxID=58291 RepID=A0A1X0S571_RHIZD|nr:hypothetical protein BCV71DRAFT_283364 [Rhizopus microsporus]
MLIGDRGTGIRSHIKGFRRYGGRWKEQLHGKHVNVCITNGHMTSQTCIYRYQKLCHPKAMLVKKNKQVSQETKGALMCVNPKCVAVNSGRSIKSRNALSSLAISLSGLTRCLIGSLLFYHSPNLKSLNLTLIPSTNSHGPSFLQEIT